MATHSSIPAWRFPWTEEPGRLQSMGSQGSDMTEGLSTHAKGFLCLPPNQCFTHYSLESISGS